MQGTVYKGEYTCVRYKPGSVLEYRICVSPGADESAALLVHHDGLNEAEVNAMQALHAEGKAPACVAVGLRSGSLTMADGTVRAMRLNEYDVFDREYADLLTEELIPELTRRHGLRYSSDPDMHMISGGSSGGISAFQVAWYRTDFFRRLYISSPSFLAMDRGDEYIALIRKFETKPFRIYMEYSENEPNDYFGSSYCAALSAKMALEFAGYDLQCVYWPGEGHCSRYGDAETQAKGFAWLWKDWETVPLSAPRNSPRVEKVADRNTAWEACGAFPEDAADGTQVLSSDRQRMYICDPDSGDILMYPVKADGSLGGRYLQCRLHIAPGFEHPGAYDMCVDEEDRIYAATELGIQCIRSYGLADAILALPGNTVPRRVAFGGADGHTLYAQTDCGVFCRRMPHRGAGDRPAAAKQISYYD